MTLRDDKCVFGDKLRSRRDFNSSNKCGLGEKETGKINERLIYITASSQYVCVRQLSTYVGKPLVSKTIELKESACI